MSATSLLARLGLRIATLGSVASLAIAAPIGEGDVSQAAHTHPARTGWYFPTPTSIGVVVNGVERMRTWADGSLQIGNTFTVARGPGVIYSEGTIYVRQSALIDAGAIAINAQASDNFTLLLTAAVGATRVLSLPTNLVAGMGWIVRIKQPAAGGPCNLTYDPAYVFPYGITPTLSTTADAVDLLSCYYDGTTIFSTITPSYGVSPTGYDIAANTLTVSGLATFNGAENHAIVTVSAGPVTLDETHSTVCVDATSGSIVVNLPVSTALRVNGRVYNVKKIDASANTVTVTRAGTDLIDGATTNVLTTQWQSRAYQAQAIATAWRVI